MHRNDAEPIAIAVLARAPLPGIAKTRLIPALGGEGAASLHALMMRRAVETACAAAIGPVTVWATPDPTHPAFAALTARFGVGVASQPPGDLGSRMHAAFVARSPALVIGTDCPALTPAHLQQSAAVLREGGRAVLIPAEDGGYVLIGLRRPLRAMFDHLAWGTPTVMAETRARMVRNGLSWRELPPLWDVDRPEDLTRLPSIPDFAPAHPGGFEIACVREARDPSTNPGVA